MKDPQGVVQKAENDLVLSFLSVRRAIGALGFFLPVALLVYGLFSADGILRSISAAYYSPMREIFVGTLIAQAVFLWSYEGFRRNAGEIVSDKATARIAAVAAALVALAPTSPAGILPPTAPPFDPVADCTLLQCQLGIALTGRLHLAAAAIYFAALAVYCLVLFRRGRVDSDEKLASNRIYRICGWTIVVCIALIGLLFLTGLDETLSLLRPIFWLELVATFAFATSWMVKGDALRPLVSAMTAWL
ncbi:hypothetical protein JHW45_14485 [Paracoccus stylophorae]|uniref:DUF998 domain-containing protein n=1 Tax=Paracoccus stylophorae TaxID=659350 RepID=A0ABY7ST91_9RHOB|nr:hypothetical protein [Paracoccus stylophorae]WCR10261.1 hypothetical protein JHW45_14485 [Paracoccus stylophorae]